MIEPNEGQHEFAYNERDGLAESIQRKLALFGGVVDTKIQPLLGELREILSKLNGQITPEEYKKADARVTEIFNTLGEPQV